MNLQEIGKTCKTSNLVDRSQSLPDCFLYLDFSSKLFTLQKQSPTQTLDRPSSSSPNQSLLTKPSLLYSPSASDNFEITSFAAFAPPNKSLQHLMLGTSTGNLLLLSPAGDVTKTIEAVHGGSVTFLQFSGDGHSLMSAGEDGTVKLWSTSGMLRKKVLALGAPITAMHWSADTSLLALGTPNKLIIHHFLNNLPDVTMAVDSDDPASPASPSLLVWSPCSRFLLMGSELCRYTLFSPSGETLLQSETYSLPFENGGWLPSSQGFLVSSQTHLLCSDIHGKIFAKKVLSPKQGIVSISLPNHKTQAMIVQAHGGISSLPLVLLTPLHFKHFEVSTNNSEKLVISNTLTGYSETLDTPVSSISAIDCNQHHLALVVQDKLAIYDLDNPLTPTLQDFTGGSPHFLTILGSRILVACPPQIFCFALSGKCLSVMRLPVSVSAWGLSPSSLSFCAESLFVQGILTRRIHTSPTRPGLRFPDFLVDPLFSSRPHRKQHVSFVPWALIFGCQLAITPALTRQITHSSHFPKRDRLRLARTS